MALGEALEKIVLRAAQFVGTLQVGVNKILWGTNKEVRTPTAVYNTESNQVETRGIVGRQTQEIKRFAETGLFNALDVLASVDLCNVLMYIFDNINIKKQPRPPRPWTEAQTGLFTIQDGALLIQTAIDKYLAYPNVFIGSYLGTGANPITQQEAIDQSGTPFDSDNISGIAIEKYNVYNLTKSIQDIIRTIVPQGQTGFTNEEREILSQVPALAGNLNILEDITRFFSKYTDYRNISNEDLVKLQEKIQTLRAVCVTIQNLNFQSALALAGNFLGTDVRRDVQKISQLMDPKKILSILKQISNSIQSFIRIARKIQGIIQQAQFIIKICILLVKIFKFVRAFFKANPLASIFTTAGIQTALSEANQAAREASGDLIKLLKSINALLQVVTSFVRYLLANANELLVRLNALILQLEACDGVKDSDVVAELKKTRDDLQVLQEELNQYIISVDSRRNTDQTEFGQYSIRIIREELTDPAIRNPRRRGVALDQNGNIAVSSDLTFATNNAVIIEEVKIKLISAGLVLPTLATLDGADLAIISESIDFLDTNDLLQNDLNIETFEGIDDPENQDENQGLGLNAFINNLPGGKRLRKRVKASLSNASSNLRTKIDNEKQVSNASLGITSNSANVQTRNNPNQAQVVRNPRRTDKPS
jgi:hypothetical protein